MPKFTLTVPLIFALDIEAATQEEATKIFASELGKVVSFEKVQLESISVYGHPEPSGKTADLLNALAAMAEHSRKSAAAKRAERYRARKVGSKEANNA